jgi:tetratricopeptide (TPR) repeat protein
MFGKKQVSKRSGFPFSQPFNKPAVSESYEEFLERMESLFNEDDPDAYFDAIESAPARWRRKPELMTAKAVGHFRMGEADEGMQVLNEVERVHPKFAPLYYYKAMHFMQQMFPACVLRNLEKVHSLGTLDESAEEQIAIMDNVARGMIQELANELGASFVIMQKASWHNEMAQEKLSAGQWQASEQHAREAVRLIPNWASPRNNRAFVLYYMGKTQDAIAEAEKTLSLDAKNFHALKNLVLFYSGLGRDAEAHPYIKTIRQIILSSLDNLREADLVISLLGFLNEHELLWKIGQKYLKRGDDELFDVSWYTLGVAALLQGHIKEGRKLLEKTSDFYEAADDLLDELDEAEQRKRRPLIPSVYYLSLSFVLPAAILAELIEILSKHKGDGDIPPHIARKLDDYLKSRPFVINGLLRMLPDPYVSKGVPGMLLSLNRPELDARLLEFALGQEGGDKERTNVLFALSQEGRAEMLPSPLRFWNAELGEWRDVELMGQILTDDIDLNISETAARVMEKAQQTEDPKKKIAFLRNAAELDPNSGYAVHMLGSFLMQNGKREEGLRFARKAIEVDPDYMFAYANLALIEAQEDEPNEELIREYIAKVNKAPVLTPQTSFIAHVAAMHLAYHKDDFEAARREYEIASEIRPDDPLLDGWDDHLKFADVFHGDWFEELRIQWRDKAHNKAIRTKLEAATTSEVTLNSLTRDVLGSIARLWGIPPYGKKAELIKNISARMQDRDAIKIVLNELPSNARDALRWVLENNGVRSWQEFTEKFGDDLQESPHWNYHEPESVMGRLRFTGLLAKGTLENGQVLFIPVDARVALKTIFGA